MPNITTKQKEVLNAIMNYIEKNGYSPAYRDLMDDLGLKSVSTISGHMDRLKEKGYISFMPGSPRTITVLKRPLLF
ncbi:winged helix-turn-helix transcriptional regulator [Lederbergia wuyishanensis]|uniref:Repressor LexA n=1 Tax=Lederbergia wuyishanensis TaxID=1347903 RepID=A0ABU0D4F9_9BACI|nr:winged helix-turn-helix transcriptional regulator [Lederbergia wuyishanensis]MCJ8008135.1 winged helix-turn-helix transcriptional regulator [Lederbergia wuyishanensis]MDQ0343279.1 repressor LexA [Lederbergia wuyishanensis]